MERPRRRLRIASALLLGGLVSVGATMLPAACIATAPEGLQSLTEDDAGTDLVADAGGAPDAQAPLPDDDPHAVYGADPAHGPFSGGQRVLLTGNGFTSDVRIWFGEQELTDVLPIDPGRAQVTAPPHAPGSVDITAQNGNDESTRRTLAGGYTYDAVYASPSSGPIAGGNEIRIFGAETTWDASTSATIDLKPCTSLTPISSTELLCTVPKGTPGAKTLQVIDDGTPSTVLDGYTYEDSADGFQGGLSGGPLSGELTALVYSDFTGEPIEGALVIAGSDAASALVSQADASGIATISDPALSSVVTVTIAAPCFSPITFVDVPVDTVTVYLDPVLTPACAGDGDPPPVGGGGSNASIIRGEIVWPSSQEFQKGLWLVPSPQNENEKPRAYVFTARTSPSLEFSLPPATSAVTPTSPGDAGYEFIMTTPPGNKTLYALAGIEDRTADPPTFIAYYMGVVRGVPAGPGKTTDDVFIQMNSTLDLALTMNANPPAPGPKGPDRLRTTIAVALDSDGFAILPAAQKAALLPLSGTLGYVGLPLLSGNLLGGSYRVTARAVTGPGFSAPMSVVADRALTTTSQPLALDGFVGLPSLDAPSAGGGWDGTSLGVTYATAGSSAPIDLTVYEIEAAGGVMTWTIAVPDDSHAISVPDLRTWPDVALPSGPLTVAVYGAFIDGFNYGELRYRNLRPQGMTAYSLDYFNRFW